MRKTREILRQKLLLKQTHRAIARSVGISSGSVAKATLRATSAGLTTWAQVDALSEEELDRLMYGPPLYERAGSTRPEPDCEWIHRERRRLGVTLDLLHHEYLGRHPHGLQYTSFCERYNAWLKRRGLVMRQLHVAGEKMFVDYSGKRPEVMDPATGEVTKVELFVAVLGASNYTYAEATASQQGPDWIASHIRALAFFGGAPRAIVCDQLKSGVTRACRYEPEVQRTYEDLANHYETTVLPARPYKPKDKAKVEGAVLIVQRWVLARIRNEVFSSLGALNERIAELMVDLNARQMRRYGRSRRELFEQLERETLTPLPSTPFEYATWKKARVNIDYHVAFENHLYSVPSKHVHEEVWVRAAGNSIEVLLKGTRIALHPRSHKRGGYTTTLEHMPTAHREHAQWTPSRILSWADKTGPAVALLCAALLHERRHPEQGFRSCLGILRLSKKYGDERLDAACKRAHAAGARSYRSVESILKTGLDRVPAQAAHENDGEPRPPIAHENVRGPDYYLN